MLFWYLKSYFDIRTQSENVLFIFKVLFLHSNGVGKCYFEIENPILTFELSRKMLFWHSKAYSDIRTESENAIFDIQNPILTFELSRKSYFDILNPIMTFELSRKMVSWYSKSYFDIRTYSEKHISTFKILFWLSNWVGKCYFDIQNPILTFELGRKIVFWH